MSSRGPAAVAPVLAVRPGRSPYRRSQERSVVGDTPRRRATAPVLRAASGRSCGGCGCGTDGTRPRYDGWPARGRSAGRTPAPETVESVGEVHDRVRVVVRARSRPASCHGSCTAGPATPGQLRHPAAYVRALAGRTGWPGVSGLSTRLGRVSVPVPATHCQLSWLLARSPSTSRSRKWRAPTRQSDVQGLGEEARGQQPAAVVHPALVAQLAHRRVHHRVAGAALPPGRDLLVPASRSRHRSCRAR